MNIECSENIWQQLFIGKFTLNPPKLLDDKNTVYKLDASFINIIRLYSLKSQKVLSYVS